MHLMAGTTRIAAPITGGLWASPSITPPAFPPGPPRLRVAARGRFGGVASDGTTPFLATGNTFFASTWERRRGNHPFPRRPVFQLCHQQLLGTQQLAVPRHRRDQRHRRLGSTARERAGRHAVQSRGGPRQGWLSAYLLQSKQPWRRQFAAGSRPITVQLAHHPGCRHLSNRLGNPRRLRRERRPAQGLSHHPHQPAGPSSASGRSPKMARARHSSLPPTAANNVVVWAIGSENDQRLQRL